VRGPVASTPDVPPTGANPVRPGFEFNPAFNPGNEPDGGAFIPGTEPSNGNGGTSVDDGTPVVEAVGNLVGYNLMGMTCWMRQQVVVAIASTGVLVTISSLVASTSA